MTEREALIAKLEASGFLDPACGECQAHLYPAEDPRRVFYPNHRALSSCQSGKRPHCTCDACF